MKFIFSIIIFFQSAFTFAGEFVAQDINRVRDKLIKNKEVHGNFTQIRKVLDPKLVLESSGSFSFKLPLELQWHQTKPFKLDLGMTTDQIVQKNPDGSVQTMTKQEQPVVFIFSSSFLGIFSGDQKLIDKNFDYKVFFKKAIWTMELDPKDELLKKVISKVLITGSDYIDKVIVFEKSGNTTEMKFSKVQRVQ